MELRDTREKWRKDMKSRIHEIMKSKNHRREKSYGILKNLL